jgi:creatinine amidohydrolase
MKKLLSPLLLFFTFSQLNAQQKISTCEMDRVNWMEFAEFVPQKSTQFSSQRVRLSRMA